MEQGQKRDWSWLKPAFWGLVIGFIGGLFAMPYGFGYVSPTTLHKQTFAASEQTAGAILSPLCAEKFAALPDLDKRTALVVDGVKRDYVYAMHDAFPKELAPLITMPGETSTNDRLIMACARRLVGPLAKSAALDHR